jgi:hypothetical protein
MEPDTSLKNSYHQFLMLQLFENI